MDFYDILFAKRRRLCSDYYTTLFARAIGGGASYIIETVTGTSPLSIADAVGGRIMSLIQYGKCAQASTPTPSSPVPIKINNGTLKMVDDELPNGYKRIKSIGFDGDFHYDTGKTLLGSDNVTMTLDNTTTSGQNVFGSYNGTSSGTKNFSLYLYGGGSTSNCYLRYGEQLVRPRYGNGQRTITFGKDGTDGFATNVTVEEDTFETVATAYIGMLPNSSSPAYTGKIVGDILVSDRLHYIPCENPSGVIGYYEIENGEFLAPNGTGTPTAGDYDHSHETVLIVDGTPEVLSVASQTASVANLYAIGGYEDEQDVISGKVKRKVGMKIFDGTESWSALTYGYTTDVIDDFPNESFAASCTHFVGSSSSSGTSGQFRMYYTSGGVARSYFYVNMSTYASVDEWKAYLAEQFASGTPVIVVYPLKETVEESVTAQPLTLAEGDNTLTATAEVSGIEFEVKYKKSAA